MKPKMLVAFFGFSWFLIQTGWAADEVKVTTYYPAPWGEYSEMRARKAVIGTVPTGANPTDPMTVYGDVKVNSVLMIGRGRPTTGPPASTAPSGIWVGDAYQDWIDPAAMGGGAAKWTPILKTRLGRDWSPYYELTAAWRLPPAVPGRAKEVLISAYWVTGTLHLQECDVEFYTAEGSVRYSKYLIGYGFGGSHGGQYWTASDNFWLPVTADRWVRMEVHPTPGASPWLVRAYVVGYR